MNSQIFVTRCEHRPYSFVKPFESGEYALLLFTPARDASRDEISQISEAIVRSGCRYVVCYGHNCELWHDYIDETCVGPDGNGTDFVMTTWHHGDTPEEVVHFFSTCSFFEEFTPTQFSLTIIGTDPATEQKLLTEIEDFVKPSKRKPG